MFIPAWTRVKDTLWVFSMLFCLSLFLLKEKVTKKFKEKANAPLPFPGQRHFSPPLFLSKP
jgi:hypothetical protein